MCDLIAPSVLGGKAEGVILFRKYVDAVESDECEYKCSDATALRYVNICDGRYCIPAGCTLCIYVMRCCMHALFLLVPRVYPYIIVSA